MNTTNNQISRNDQDTSLGTILGPCIATFIFWTGLRLYFGYYNQRRCRIYQELVGKPSTGLHVEQQAGSTEERKAIELDEMRGSDAVVVLNKLSLNKTVVLDHSERRT